MHTADNLNTLARFLGVRDVEKLTRHAPLDRYGFEQADVMVLLISRPIMLK